MMRLNAECSRCGHAKTAAIPTGVYRIDAHCSRCGHTSVVTLKSFDAAFYKSFADTWLKTHAKAESQLIDDLMPVFHEQAEQVGEALEREYGNRDGEQLAKHTTATAMAKSLFTPDKWTDAIKEAAMKSLGKTMAAGAVHELKSFGGGKATSLDIGLDFDFGVDLPQNILDGLSAELSATMKEGYWGGIAETQLDDLAMALQEALDAGKDPRQIAADVQDVFGGTMGKERATRIARSESTMAMNAGQYQARLELHAEGIVSAHEWMATLDNLTRQTHAYANGQIRPVNKPFLVGGEQAMYPGARNLSAGQRVNCRCAAVSVADFSDKAFLLSLKRCEAHQCGAVSWPYRVAA